MTYALRGAARLTGGGVRRYPERDYSCAIVKSMALGHASGLWGNLLLKGLFTHNRGRGARVLSENEKLTGGVLSGRQEQ
jgi:hypothetical protein